jgi:hypothetical protein
MNISFLDSAILAQTAYISATSPVTSAEPSFVVKWDNVTPGPGADDIRWMDVQWLDEAEGVWHDWLLETRQVEAIFQGEMDRVYRFRARAFQKYPNGAHLWSPYRPTGDTVTAVGEPEPPPPPEPEGPILAGWVLSPEGLPLSAATVTVAGTTHITSTGADGRYAMELTPLTEPQAIVVSHPYWRAPAPVYDLVLPPTGTVSLTWSLLPPDDVVLNGEFETGLEAWTAITTAQQVPQVVSEPVLTGRGALYLNASGQQAAAVGVSQTMVLTKAWEPGLSFWYHPSTPGGEGVFQVSLTLVTKTVSTTLPYSDTISSTLASGPAPSRAESLTSTLPVTEPVTTTIRVTTTHVITPDLTVEGWQHLWSPVGPPEAFVTGTVTVLFELWNEGQATFTGVYIDQVSVGAKPGGPYKTYLPAIRTLTESVDRNNGLSR